MELQDYMTVLGGLALFLYGMHMMSAGLSEMAGNKMKHILGKLTRNRCMGVFFGMGVTAIIQSSSATTVMAVGFVNAGMMTLAQAVGVIMGANIGTTITGQLIALDVGILAPMIAFVGVLMFLFVKIQRVKDFGGMLAGLGILFIGMEMMSGAMIPLAQAPFFMNAMTHFSNPLFGILAGALFTALIQSSSASVGILQVLAITGTIPFSGAVYVLFGQNIGTCITALLASVGGNINAKRVTVVHLAFNVIGTILFTVLCIVTPLTQAVASLTSGNGAAQIANMHTIFNIGTTVTLLPAANYLIKLSEFVIKEEKKAKKEIPCKVETL